MIPSCIAAARATLLAAALAFWALAAGARDATAQVALGPEVDVGSETDFGIGGRIVGAIRNTHLEAVGSFDIYFPDDPLDFWELNGNLFYHFHLRDTDAVLPYAGGGLNISHISNGEGETDAGLNLGGGVRFATRSDASPFVELRGVIGDLDQVVVTLGILFGDTAP